MFNLVVVQVGRREAQVVVAPNQFAVFDVKCRKTGRIKPCANIGVESVRKERLEVCCLLGTTIKPQADAEIFNLFSSGNIDGGWSHLSLRGQQFCLDRLDACQFLGLLLDFPQINSLLHAQPAFRCGVE